MNRFIGVITLGPLIWLLARWLSRQEPGWWRDRLEIIIPKRLLDTRPGRAEDGESTPVPVVQPKPDPYVAPGPDDPESGEPTLTPEGSPGAHRVVPN